MLNVTSCCVQYIVSLERVNKGGAQTPLEISISLIKINFNFLILKLFLRS